MPTTLPSPFDVLPMVAFEVDRGLVASAVTGGSALMERSGIGNGSDIAILHPTLVEPLREAIGGRSVRRRVVVAGAPMLLDAQPHDGGALGLLLALAAVLGHKARREEARLCEAHPDYAAYRTSTAAIVPFLPWLDWRSA